MYINYKIGGKLNGQLNLGGKLNGQLIKINKTQQSTHMTCIYRKNMYIHPYHKPYRKEWAPYVGNSQTGIAQRRWAG